MLDIQELLTKQNGQADAAPNVLSSAKILHELHLTSLQQAGSWAKDNLLKPSWNMGVSAYNTVGNVVNGLSGKEVLAKATLAEMTPAEFGSKEYIAQTLSTGLSAAVVYGLAGKLAGGLLRAGGSALAVETRLASLVGPANSARAYGLGISEKTSQIIGAVAYDGLRDVHHGETRTGNMAGSLTGFLLFEHFNPKTAKLSFLPRLGTQALIGSGGAGMQHVVSARVSGHYLTGDELMQTMATGAFMNTALPVVQHGLSIGIGKVNTATGRGNFLERHLKLNGLQEQSPTLDALAKQNPSLRIQPGSHNEIDYRQQKITISALKDASNLGHELAHNQWQKNNQIKFQLAAEQLQQGNSQKSWELYRQARLESELHARRSEVVIAAESNTSKTVELDPRKIATASTPEGISYEALWRRDFEQFKSTKGQDFHHKDYNNTDLNFFHKLSALSATFEKVLANQPLNKSEIALLAEFKIKDLSTISQDKLLLIKGSQEKLVRDKLKHCLDELSEANTTTDKTDVREVANYITGEVHRRDVASSAECKFVSNLIENNPLLLHEPLSCKVLASMTHPPEHAGTITNDPSALAEIAKSLNRQLPTTDTTNKQTAIEYLHESLLQFSQNHQQVGHVFLANALLDSLNDPRRFNTLLQCKEFATTHREIPVGLRQIADASSKPEFIQDYMTLLEQHSQNTELPSWQTKDGGMRPEMYLDGDNLEHQAATATLKAVATMSDLPPGWVFVPSGKLSTADKMKIDGIFMNLTDGRWKPVDFTMRQKDDVAWSLRLYKDSVRNSAEEAVRQFKKNPAAYLEPLLLDDLHYGPNDLQQAGLNGFPSLLDWSGNTPEGMFVLKEIASKAERQSDSKRYWNTDRYSWSGQQDKWSFLSDYAHQAKKGDPNPPKLHKSDPLLSARYESIAQKRLAIEKYSKSNADYKRLSNDMVDFMAIADCSETEAFAAALQAPQLRAAALHDHQEMLTAHRLMTVHGFSEKRSVEAVQSIKNHGIQNFGLSEIAKVMKLRDTVNKEHSLSLSMSDVLELDALLSQTPGLKPKVALAMQSLAATHRTQLKPEMSAIAKQSDPVSYAMDRATANNTANPEAWENFCTALESLQSVQSGL